MFVGSIIIIGVLIGALCIVTATAAALVHQAHLERDAAKKEVADAKTEFLSRVSYDIKTPMNVIIGTTALGLEEIDNPEKMRDCLSRIHTASEFLMGLLSDLVDMSKIETGKFHLHSKSYAFSDFAAEIRPIIEPACEKKGIRFHMPEEEININMMVDAMRLQQIFQNLLTNAVKFTPKGGDVNFRICNYATHNDIFSADYLVSDNGIGMSEEFQKMLFQPFTQETGNWAEKKNGAGLGLAITRNIVDLMGGNIAIKSELGKGTEVKVHLDIEIAAIQPEKENELLNMEEIRAILGGKRVLLAEDHPLDTEITKRILENIGMELVCVENGKEALAVFEEHMPYYFDVILLDISMPVLDGLQTSRAMRKMTHSDEQVIPIIAMSANDSTEDVHSCKEAGMNVHVAKPVEPQKLYQILCEYIQTPM
ncbi:ATP-binding response regulator [Lacrimispora defluvii]|nr:ATP-binding protein [Lacrimispora defluvii]